jgi:hypothetical protein
MPDDHQPSDLLYHPEHDYGDGWLVKVRLFDPDERAALLDAGAYRDLTA